MQAVRTPSTPRPLHLRGSALHLLAATALALTLAACSDPEAERAAAAAQAAAKEQAAEQAAAAVDGAVKAEDWRTAKSLADLLLHDHPGTAAAERVRGDYDAIKAKAEAAREAQRLAALWAYDSQGVPGGLQLSASIYAKDEVNVGGTGTTPVRLIFRDHPSWGRSSYLVLNEGDFDCYGGCRVKVTVGDAAPVSLPGTRPDTDEAIAMFIDDEKRMWRLTKDAAPAEGTPARTITVEFPSKGAGKVTAVFEVGGLDPGRLAKWN